jgi:hypothetical protein
VKWGMEANGLAAVDLQNKMTLHLEYRILISSHANENVH